MDHLDCFNIKLLHVFGMWITPNSSTSYKIYAFIMQIFFCFAFMVDLSLLLPMEHDLEGFMLSLPVSLTMAGYVIKLINVFYKQYQIHAFFTLLNSNESLDYKKEEFDIIERANKSAKTLVQVWFWIFLVAGLTAISPMMSTEPKVPYPIYYPDWREGRTMFYLSCGYQFICVVVGSICNGILDSFVSYFFTLLGGMLDALSWRLKKLRQCELNDDREVKKEFLKCLKWHKHLLRISSELENIFSTVTFTQIFLSGLIICGNLFQLSLLSPIKEPKIFFKLVSFSLAMFIQIFLPCYTANEVRNKSGELILSIYSSDWPYMSQGVKKIIVIFMQRLQRPIVITAGGIWFLGMENFMGVLRFSYSLYSFLRRVHSE